MVSVDSFAANEDGFQPAVNTCSTVRPCRDFLVHGQNTTVQSELQLLNIPIISPGWRKADVGCRLIPHDVYSIAKEEDKSR
jgi:hypothetical protein